MKASKLAICIFVIAGLLPVTPILGQTLDVIQQFSEPSMGNWNQLRLADVNGDGFDDIVARFAGPEDAGIIVGVWLFDSGTGLFHETVDCSIDLDFVANNAFLGAGDFNDDGYADIVMLSQYALDHPPKVVWGRAEWPETITTPDLVCVAPVDDDFQQSGQYASPVVGDWNGDMIADFAYPDQGTALSTGNYGGRCVVHYGSSDINGEPDLVINLQGTDLAIPVEADSADLFLRWFSPFMETGDFNGDGFEDLMAGAFYSSTSILLTSVVTGQDQEAWNSGAGLIFLGGFDFDDNPDIIMVPPNEFLQFTTPADFFYAGYWAMNLGDLDGDGTDDLGLPAWYWAITLVYQGNRGYMMAPTIYQSRILRDPMFYYTKDRYNSLGYSDQWGANLYGIGDINGDGTPDLGNARDFLGTGPLDEGIRLFLVDPEWSGAVDFTYETDAYTHVMSAHLDLDDDGQSEFFVTSAGDGDLLTLVSYNSSTATDNSIHPRSYHLGQNYPNPFNPNTAIPVQIPRESTVTLKVYGVNGDLVSVLANRSFPAGKHVINWDAEGQATGVYFCELTAMGERQIRKMLLLK